MYRSLAPRHLMNPADCRHGTSMINGGNGEVSLQTAKRPKIAPTMISEACDASQSCSRIKNRPARAISGRGCCLFAMRRDTVQTRFLSVRVTCNILRISTLCHSSFRGDQAFLDGKIAKTSFPEASHSNAPDNHSPRFACFCVLLRLGARAFRKSTGLNERLWTHSAPWKHRPFTLSAHTLMRG